MLRVRVPYETLSLSFLLNLKGEEEHEQSTKQVADVSQKEFGNLLGVSAQAICKWEQNLCCPDIILLPQLAWILNCTVDSFFEMCVTG